jgi:hypothetical protein
MRKWWSMAAVLAAWVLGPAGPSLAGDLVAGVPPEGYAAAPDVSGPWGPTMSCCGAGIDCQHGYPPPPNYSPLCCFGYSPPSNYSPIAWVSSPGENMRLVRMRLAGMGIHPTPMGLPAVRREIAPAPTPEGDKGKKVEGAEPKKDELPPPKKIEEGAPPPKKKPEESGPPPKKKPEEPTGKLNEAPTKKVDVVPLKTVLKPLPKLFEGAPAPKVSTPLPKVEDAPGRLETENSLPQSLPPPEKEEKQESLAAPMEK